MKKSTEATNRGKYLSSQRKDTAMGFSRKNTSMKDKFSSRKHDIFPPTAQTEQRSKGRKESCYRECDSYVMSTTDSNQSKQPNARKSSYEEYSSDTVQSSNLTSASTKHHTTPTNSKHLMRSRSLCQQSDNIRVLGSRINLP